MRQVYAQETHIRIDSALKRLKAGAGDVRVKDGEQDS